MEFDVTDATFEDDFIPTVISLINQGPYTHSLGSGQSSGGSSGGGPIRRHRSTTNPSFSLPKVTEFDPQLDEEDLDKELWTLLKNNEVPSSRQVFIMFHMSLKDKKKLRNTPAKNVYNMAKQVEKTYRLKNRKRKLSP
ncbi:unnamed protein product [Trifolium pratense]|uniref:Uncharacterized protein n=1 Tax=Trifolium pratense TaxID=57577 RepID=A0ACB0LIN4_TRIPR|nr:unnamed protein product [Trifolium pratense]